MKYLLIFLSVFEISDGIFTHWALSGGSVQEWNPLVRGLAEGWYLFLKAIGAIICVVLLWIAYKRFPRISLIGARSVVIFYGFVLIWNLYVFLSP